MASNNIVNNYCSTLIQIATDVVKKYESNVEIIKKTEDELNDVYHEIELGKPQDLNGGYKLYKQVKDLRMQRRQAKDENDLLKDMYEYIKSQPGQSFKSKIQSIQGSSAKVYEAQSRRTYNPRQRSDLTITNKTCEVNRPFEDLMKEFKQTKVTMQGGKLRK
jgi:DNA-binding transcriptional MerR regulator